MSDPAVAIGRRRIRLPIDSIDVENARNIRIEGDIYANVDPAVLPGVTAEESRETATRTRNRRPPFWRRPWRQDEESDMEKALRAIGAVVGVIVGIVIIGLLLYLVGGAIIGAAHRLASDAPTTTTTTTTTTPGGSGSTTAPVAPPRGAATASPCKPGFDLKGGMCVGPHVSVDPDGPDPYRKVAKCTPGETRQIKVQLPSGGYRMVDQTCRAHPRTASN